MSKIPVLKVEEVLNKLAESERTRLAEGHSKKYLAMYSSWYGGIVTESSLMLAPMDDHMVHRGDGIFEAFRLLEGGIFDFSGHMDRLKISAESIDLKWPKTQDEIKEICIELARVAAVREGTYRLFVSRGPGSFSPNPYESVGSQLYIILTQAAQVPQKWIDEGVKLILSKIPVKEGLFSRTKSCNYLQNVLMKKESVDCGADFSIGLSREGLVTEGPTENVFLVSQDDRLLAPEFDYILKGTSLLRVMELAKKSGKFTEVSTRPLGLDDFMQAKEVMMVGTTIGVLPVRQFQEKHYTERYYAKFLRELLEQDTRHNHLLRVSL